MLAIPRVLDITISFFGIILLIPIFLVLAVGCHLKFRSAIFYQERVGRNEVCFKLFKFRSMDSGAPEVPTHLLPERFITDFGRFLRKSKLDELPQLWNVFIGEMSLVGPRPNLPNQYQLMSARRRLNVYRVRPGITGLAQINGIDMSSPAVLAEIDEQMIAGFSTFQYLKILGLTLLIHRKKELNVKEGSLD